jgi:orotate phosphoribosyltransferase
MTTIKLKRTRAPHVSLAHLVALVIVACSVYLMVDFGIRAANLFQAHQRAAEVERELAEQMSLRDRLQRRLEYVQSDAYVEEVARTQLKWSRPGETVVVIDDLATTGGSKFEAIEKLTAVGLKVKDIVVLVDRQSGAKESLEQAGYSMYAVLTITQLLDYYESTGKVEKDKIEETRKFLKQNG